MSGGDVSELDPTVAGCQELVRQLEKCLSESKWKRLLGGCSDLVIQVDRCNRRLFELRRQANYQKSLEEKKKLQERFKAQKEEKSAIN